MNFVKGSLLLVLQIYPCSEPSFVGRNNLNKEVSEDYSSGALGAVHSGGAVWNVTIGL